MTSAPSCEDRIRVRGSGFDITQVGRAGSRTTFDVASEPTGARVARIELDTARGRALASIRLEARRGAPSLRALAAPLARLLRGFARPPVRATVRDVRSRTIARLPNATRATLAQALGRLAGSGVPRRSGAAIDRGALENYGHERAMARTREPSLLRFAGTDIHDRAQWLEANAAAAWRRMQRAAAADGVPLQLVSAFRSVAYQAGIVARKLGRGESLEEILRVNAAPGYSEHHSGRALDLTTPGYPALEPAFEDSPAFAWLDANARRFGFTLSYPRDNPHGIAYEPWHWRFDPATAPSPE